MENSLLIFYEKRQPLTQSFDLCGIGLQPRQNHVNTMSIITYSISNRIECASDLFGRYVTIKKFTTLPIKCLYAISIDTTVSN